MPVVTNAELASAVQQVVSRVDAREDQLTAWQSGTPEGGPFADGTYAITNLLGETSYFKSPARLQYEVGLLTTAGTGAVATAEAARDAAEAALASAVVQATNASSSASTASTKASEAQVFRNEAANAEANALAHRNAASASASAAALSEADAEAAAIAAAASAASADADATSAAASAAAAATFDPVNFYTKTQADTLLAAKLATADFSWNNLAGKPTTFTPSAHTHVIADVTGLQTALDGKQSAGSYAAAVHVHSIADVTGLQTALDGKQAAGSYAAASHTHVIADVTGLQAALDGKQPAGSYLTGITGSMVTTALGYTPYNATNPNGYISGITSGMVTTALGYTPANKAGDTFTGAVSFPGGSAVAANGDVYARRSSGNTGVYYFVDGGDKYLYWDGVQYLYGGSYTVAASRFYGVNDVRAPIFYDSDNTGWYLDPASTSSLNNLNVNGSTVYPAQWTTRFQSSSDFPNGTLVTTDIPATGWAGDSFIIEITGKSYDGSNPPFKVVAQGYLYNDTIINYSGINYGGSFSSYIKVFQDGGVLKFWWPRISYWNSFNVNVMGMDGPSNNTITRNRVTAITDSTEPTGTKKVQINLNQALRENTWINNKYFASSGEIFGTVFYDSNDGAYYVDPSSNSVLNTAYFRNSTGYNVLLGNASNFGYSTGYRTLLLGNQANTTVCIGVDPIGNPSGSFNGLGEGREVMFRNGVSFITPNSANNGYNAPLYLLDGYAYNNTSMRSPIFYDYNNTSYYLDAASNSRFSSFDVDTTSRFFGGYGSAPGLAVENISTFARLAFYDLDFYDWDVGSIFRLNSFASSSTSMRAPVFYDSDNTGYYADPAGNSVFNTLQASNVVCFPGWTSYPGIDANAYTYSAISSFTYSNNAPYAGPFVALPASGYGLQLNAPYNGGAALSFRTRNGDSSTFNPWYKLAVYDANPGAGNLYAAIYYDPTNTGYYTRPAGSSYIYELTAANTIYSNGWFRSYGDTGWYSQTYGGGIYMTDGTYVRVYNGKEFYASNIITSASSVRAPIFYDTDNTGYYLDASSAGTSLNVAGAIVAAGNITAYSDARVKTNVTRIGGALDKLSKIAGYTYTRTDLADSDRVYGGVIAQEVEAVLPEAVFDNGSHKAVDYNATTALLIEAVKELRAEVEALKNA